MGEAWKQGTICVQGGYSPKSGEPRVLPLYQSTTYKYDTADNLAALFDLQTSGYIYTRIGNSTIAAFEEKLTQLEGGVGAVATASEQAAITLAVLNICSSGDHLLCSSTVYGGTYNLFAVSLQKLGIDVTFFNPNMTSDEIVRLAKENTKLVYGESLGNPAMNILNFKECKSAAQQLGVPLMIDNTLTTPYLCTPFQYGADIVVYSTTKYIDGHASCIGGTVIDGGSFDWTNGKFSDLTELDESMNWDNYPGLTSSNQYERAQVYMPKGASGAVTFGIQGGVEATKAFIQNLKVAALVTHAADTRTCVIHPASITHRQLTEEQQYLAGVTPDLICLSVGIEEVEDLIADLHQALSGGKEYAYHRG